MVEHVSGPWLCQGKKQEFQAVALHPQGLDTVGMVFNLTRWRERGIPHRRWVKT